MPRQVYDLPLFFRYRQLYPTRALPTTGPHFVPFVLFVAPS